MNETYKHVAGQHQHAVGHHFSTSIKVGGYKSDLLELKSDLIEEIKKIVPLQMAAPDEYLKSSEVRKLMKISAGTLLHLRVSGKLPFTKIGRIVYFSREDIRRILGNGTPGNAVVKRLFRGEAHGEHK